MLLGDCVQCWIDEHDELRPRTLEQYNHILKRWILPTVGNVDVAMLTADRIRTALRQIAEQHERTAQLVYVILNAALDLAADDQTISSNPMRRLKQPRHRAAAARFWDDRTVADFLKAVSGSRWYIAWLLGVCYGLRRGEIAGLRWRDVDLPALTMHICNQRQRYSDGLRDGPPKSESGIRDIPITTDFARLLRDAFDGQQITARRGGALPVYVVCYHDNRPIDPHTLNRALARDIRAAGVEPINVHGLRHTMATAAVTHDGNLKTVQQILGHAKYTTTADIYAHVTDERERDCICRYVAAFLG